MNHISLKLPSINNQVYELYKSMRANLLFCGEDKKVIAITSCSPNEGESEISLRIAVSLAEIGKRTLLIDGNMRTSSIINETIRGNNIKGLFHCLKDNCDLKDIIYITNISNLYVMCSGGVVSYAVDLLEKKKFDQIIQALRKVYDYIIINTPPIGRVIDGAVIAASCDGSVLVIGSDITDYRTAQGIKAQLEQCGKPIIGVVLNKAKKRHVRSIKKYGKYGKKS